MPGSPITSGAAGPAAEAAAGSAALATSAAQAMNLVLMGDLLAPTTTNTPARRLRLRSRPRRIPRRGVSAPSAGLDDAGVVRRAGEASHEANGPAGREHRNRALVQR